MEDVLPFLLAIAYIIYTLYKRANKNKQKPAEATEGERKESDEQPDFKKVLEEILGGKEMKPEPVEEFYEEEAESIEAAGSEILEKIPGEEVVAQIEMPEEENETVEKEVIKDMNFYDYQNEDDGFDIDLKKAIIYSEILKRPNL